MTGLKDALATIGKDAELRDDMLALCHRTEAKLSRLDFDVREEVTGPIVDAMHADAGILKKRLKSGLTFHFRYSGKIARDFVMSSQKEPDHVWEPQTTKLLLHLAERAKTVVIGGAYAGDQALLVAQKLKSAGGTCHCFEPNAEQLEVLRLNAAENGLQGNMVINGLGLWDSERADLQLVGDDAYGSPQVGGAPSGGAQIATTSVNAYGEREGLESIDLLMLDVEGGEHTILQGASRYLSQPAGQAPNVVFEIHRSYVDWSEGLENTNIGRLLTGHGYKLYSVRDYQSNVDMTDEPVEIIEPDGTYLEGPPHGFNMLAVKDEAVVEGPLFRKCSGVSPKLLRHRDPKLHQPVGGS